MPTEGEGEDGEKALHTRIIDESQVSRSWRGLKKCPDLHYVVFDCTEYLALSKSFETSEAYSINMTSTIMLF